MGLTRIALFRAGDKNSPRMDRVRPQDLAHFTHSSGAIWVRAKSGGISTFDAQGHFKGVWWRLPPGYDYGSLLVVWNDHGGHWSWEPSHDMSLAKFKSELSAAGSQFR